MTNRQWIENTLVTNNKTTRDFRHIEGAGSIEDVMRKRHTPDCCYVYRQAVKAGRNRYENAVDQETDETYAIAIVTRNIRSSGGQDSSDRAEELCNKVSEWLLGQQPSADSGMLVYRGGSLASLKNGFYIWIELYSTSGNRRAV